jgi:hypothetical protein
LLAVEYRHSEYLIFVFNIKGLNSIFSGARAKGPEALTVKVRESNIENFVLSVQVHDEKDCTHD